MRSICEFLCDSLEILLACGEVPIGQGSHFPFQHFHNIEVANCYRSSRGIGKRFLFVDDWENFLRFFAFLLQDRRRRGGSPCLIVDYHAAIGDNHKSSLSLNNSYSSHGCIAIQHSGRNPQTYGPSHCRLHQGTPHPYYCCVCTQPTAKGTTANRAFRYFSLPNSASGGAALAGSMKMSAWINGFLQLLRWNMAWGRRDSCSFGTRPARAKLKLAPPQ